MYSTGLTIARDLLSKDRELCDSENDLPWDLEMCMVSFMVSV